MLFGLSVAVSPAADALKSDPQAGQTVANSVSAHLTPWKPTPFSDVLVNDPDLAACFLLSPHLWGDAAAPTGGFDAAGLEPALAAQLRGLVDPGRLPPLAVTLGLGQAKEEAETAAHGGSVLVLLPKAGVPSAAEIARLLAPAILASQATPAAPDRRCSEPLLALGEALANAGSLALAGLPPPLRPVRDWVDVREADAALTAFVSEALDPGTRWARRRAAMADGSQVRGASPQLATAAALLVEAFGDADTARRRPFDLLLGWRHGLGDGVPGVPRALRRALTGPLAAGVPDGKDTPARADIEEIRRDALDRLVASGAARPADVPAAAAGAVRLEVAARLRAAGEPSLCAWLTAGPLPKGRTGCRTENEDGGLVFSRPRARGFEVVWRATTGDEIPLLAWPRWVLSPAVTPSGGELWFVDPLGVWRLPLDASAAPRLVAPGAFRHLAVGADGNAACARWPDGSVVLVSDGAAREIGVGGRGGVAWLGPGLVVASDGEALSLASTQGETRPGVVALPCGRDLATARGAVYASVGAPCSAGLVRVALPERATAPLLKLPDAPIGIVPLPAGGLAFALGGGLFSWVDEGVPARIGSGLTPGPG